MSIVLVKLHIEKIQLLQAADIRSTDSLSFCFESTCKVSTTTEFSVDPNLDTPISINQSIAFVCATDASLVYQLVFRRKQRKDFAQHYIAIATAAVPMSR